MKLYLDLKDKKELEKIPQILWQTMVNRVFKYIRLEQNISEPRTDYGLLLEKTIAQSPCHEG